jgi:hypothetical protein
MISDQTRNRGEKEERVSTANQARQQEDRIEENRKERKSQRLSDINGTVRPIML